MPVLLHGLVLHRQPQGTDECTGTGGASRMMRVTTLRARADGPGQMIAYYAGLAEDTARTDGISRGPVDYYLDPNEPPGRWWGAGCKALGVSGDVSADELRL